MHAEPTDTRPKSRPPRISGEVPGADRQALRGGSDRWAFIDDLVLDRVDLCNEWVARGQRLNPVGWLIWTKQAYAYTVRVRNGMHGRLRDLAQQLLQGRRPSDDAGEVVQAFFEIGLARFHLGCAQP